MTKAPLRVDTDLKWKDLISTLQISEALNPIGSFSGIALDSRAVQPGDLFFALKASRDGHEFVRDAFQKGACAAVVHQEVQGSGPMLKVKNTSEALSTLARSVRQKWGKPIVGISGSNGKTTTKELTAAVLGGALTVLKTPGTWNNHLGIPLTLFLLRSKHDVGVMEIGINDFGEMTDLCKIVQPKIGILTNVGPVHLEKLGSLEGVAKAKGELFQALPKDGVAVLNQDDPKILELGEQLHCKKVKISLKSGADVTASVVRDYGPEGLLLKIQYGGEPVDIRTPLVGVHNVYNLLCAVGAAYALSVPKEKLQEGLNRFERPEMRLEVIQLSKNVSIVNDCYNANPASTMVALEVVRNMASGRTIAVLGDMLELGDFSARAHRDVGIRVAAQNYAYLLTLGRFAGDLRQGAIQGGMKDRSVMVFQSHSELVDALEKIVQPDDMILVKGSRGMKMEQITESFKAKFKEAKT